MLGSRPIFAASLVLPIAILTSALLMSVSTRYGYHPDELYFLQCGRHLQWGYVDQPPLTPALVRLATQVFGDSLLGLRSLAALSSGVVILLAGLLAREFGGGRFSQGVAALSAGTGGVFLVLGHIVTTSTFDLVAWVLCTYLLVRMIHSGNEHLWIPVGATVGLGLLNKWTMCLFVLGLGVGILGSEQRRWLRSPWLWAGAGIAMALWFPNLIWQARHGWPAIEMMRSLRHQNERNGYQVLFLHMQVLMIGPLVVPLCVAGIRRLWLDPAARQFRLFALAFGATMVLLIAVPGKPHYQAPAYVAVLAAGSVASSQRLQARPSHRLALGRTVVVILIGASLNLVALPILPPSMLARSSLDDIAPGLVTTYGWPQLVGQVASLYRALPPKERATTVLLTENYGEAGAIDRFGADEGLPRAYSGHNSYWWWGPPPGPVGVVIAIGFRSPDLLRRLFSSVTPMVSIDNGRGLRTIEQGRLIWLCLGATFSLWATMWPYLRHYD
jgi:4-amino-4-deoxy-L-arabinose transferase-like glycosyltransferase